MDDADHFEFIRVGLPLAALISAVSWFLFVDRDPIPAPPNGEAYGCYIEENGGRVVIDGDGFQSVHPKAPTVQFKILRTNSGLRLQLEEAPPALMRSDRTKALFAGKPISLQVQTNLGTKRVVDGFWIAEAEGRHTLYRRALDSYCG